MNCVIEPGLLEGTVSIPASKSAAHRALICAALAKGTSRLTNLSDSEDIAATIGALQQMGAKITRTGSSVTVTGILSHPHSPLPWTAVKAAPPSGFSFRWQQPWG